MTTTQSPGRYMWVPEGWRVAPKAPIGDMKHLYGAFYYQALLASAPSPPEAPAEMRAFGASDAACYKWPDDTAEHRACRAAYIEGAAAISPPQPKLPSEEEIARVLYNEVSEPHSTWASLTDFDLRRYRGAAKSILALLALPLTNGDHP